MTLSKLAQLANVSVSVVSKAFSGREDVSESMREHVFSVAREHGCFGQFYHARYDKPVIAVIIPEAISKYYIKYVEELKVRLERNNCTLLLSISNFDQKMEGELIRYYSEHGKVDALIVVNGYCDKLVNRLNDGRRLFCRKDDEKIVEISHRRSDKTVFTLYNFAYNKSVRRRVIQEYLYVISDKHLFLVSLKYTLGATENFAYSVFISNASLVKTAESFNYLSVFYAYQMNVSLSVIFLNIVFVLCLALACISAP